MPVRDAQVQEHILRPQPGAGGGAALPLAGGVVVDEVLLGAGPELVLVGPEAVSGGEDVLLRDQNSTAVRVDAAALTAKITYDSEI